MMRKVIIGLIIGCALLAALAAAYIVYEITQLPQLPDELSRLDLSDPTVIYARDGRPLYQMRTRQIVSLDRISPNFVKAILSVEDHNFHSHKGIDKFGLMKAVLMNVVLRRRSPGRSTITQQLAKNLFLSFDRSYRRKTKDILLALQFERRYSKESILAAYCNQINFGNGAFGVENAALSYFGKHASELNLTEGVALAALPQSPSNYNLYIDPERAKPRFMYILNRLKKLGWIADDEYTAASEYSFTLKNLINQRNSAPHFIEMVKNEMIGKYGEEMLYYGGLKIYTTIDIGMQEHAMRSVQESMLQLDERLGKPDYRSSKREDKASYPEGSLIAVDPADGAVRALVGGRDPQNDYYSRPLAARRSPGSSFKPVVYLTAIEELGVNGGTVMVDSQVTYPDNNGAWTPRNFNPEFLGPIVLKQALRKSINTVAAQLIDRVTPEKVVEKARLLGVQSELLPVYSLALGSNGVAGIEHAGIYAALAAGGEYHEPYYISRIEYANGKVLEERPPPLGERVAEPEKVYLLLDMMKGALEPGGTGSAVRNYGFSLPACGKTGTTNDFRDSWFAGMTPDIAAVAWVGYDDFSPMYDRRRVGITGSSGALPIWATFMKRIETELSGSDFPIPAGIEFMYVDINTGMETTEDAENAIRIAVLK